MVPDGGRGAEVLEVETAAWVFSSQVRRVYYGCCVKLILRQKNEPHLQKAVMRSWFHPQIRATRCCKSVFSSAVYLSFGGRPPPAAEFIFSLVQLASNSSTIF